MQENLLSEKKIEPSKSTMGVGQAQELFVGSFSEKDSLFDIPELNK